MKIYVETLGCQMNLADSGEMGEHFARNGFSYAKNKEEADVVLLNTCTVRQHAEDKALSFIGRLKVWKKEDPNRVLIVAGCAAERLKDHLKRRFPHIDLVIGAKSIERFPELVAPLLRGRFPAKAGKAPAAPLRNGFDWFNESEKSFGSGDLRPSGKPLSLGKLGETAFVTIMRGCNYSCSYCIVPSVRGREVYRPAASVLDEARRKAAQGAKEIMLLGQTVNSYWHKEQTPGGGQRLVDFSILLKEVGRIENVERIRFMSPHPHYMSDHLIQTLAECPKTWPEVHLPVQSGSDAVLKAMKRNYTRAEFCKIAAKLRKAVPGLRLSTDFIVGFPGESEQDFRQTLSLVDEVDFSLAYCFKYSLREGTEAAKLPDDVPQAAKEKRLARLLEKVEKSRS